MQIKKASKVKTVSYLGKPFETQTFTFVGTTTRCVIRRSAELSDVNICRGDGRTLNFKQFLNRELTSEELQMSNEEIALKLIQTI